MTQIVIVCENGTSRPGPSHQPTNRPSSVGGSANIAVTWRRSSSSTSTSLSIGMSSTAEARLAASANSAITSGSSGLGSQT